MDIKFFNKYKDLMDPFIRNYYDDKFRTPSSNNILSGDTYLDRKRREAEGLENKITDQGLSTERFNWAKVPGNALSFLTGGFTMIPRLAAVTTTLAKGDMPELYPELSKNKGLWQNIKGMSELGLNLFSNQGAVQNMSIDTVLRKYAGPWASKHINYWGPQYQLAEKLGIDLPDYLRSTDASIDHLRKSFKNFYEGKKANFIPLDVIREGYKKLGISDDMFSKMARSKWGYLIPVIQQAKTFDALNNMTYEMTKDPAALISFVGETVLDPATWIGAPGATKMLKLGSATVKASAARGLIDDALRIASKGAGLSDDAASLINTGLKLAGTKTDDAAMLMRSIKSGSKPNIDLALSIINKVDDAKILRNKKLMGTVADRLSPYGINALEKGNIGLTDEGMRLIGKERGLLSLGGYTKTPEMDKAFLKYADDFYGRTGQLPVGEIDNVSAFRRANADLLHEFESKMLAEAIEPNVMRRFFGSGTPEKYISRGGLEWMPFGIRTNKTIFPYASWEKAGIPRLGQAIANKMPYPAKWLGNKAKILFRPARLAPQELHDIFLTQMQFTPPYRMRQQFDELQKLRREYNLPEILIDKNETLYTFQNAYQRSLDELLVKSKNNPKLANKLKELAAREQKSLAPELERIATLEQKMGNINSTEVREMVGNYIDAQAMNEFKIASMKDFNKYLDTLDPKIGSMVTDIRWSNQKLLKDLYRNYGIKYIKDERKLLNNLVDAIVSDREIARKVLNRNIAQTEAFSKNIDSVLSQFDIHTETSSKLINGRRHVDVKIQDAQKNLVNLQKQLQKNIKTVPENLPQIMDLRINSGGEKVLRKQMEQAIQEFDNAPLFKNLGMQNTFDLMSDPTSIGKGAHYTGTNLKYNLMEKGIPGPSSLSKTKRVAAGNQVVVGKTPIGYTKSRVLSHEYAHVIGKRFFDDAMPSSFNIIPEGNLLRDELMAEAIGFKAGTVSYDDALRYLEKNSRHYKSGIGDKTLKALFDDAIQFTDDMIVKKNLKRNEKYLKLIDQAKDSVEKIKARNNLIRDKMRASYEGSGPWKSYKKELTDLRYMQNADWPSEFQIKPGMTKLQKQRIYKLRDYAQEWIKLPENEMAYARALSDKLKEIRAYENIKGIATPERIGRYGEYVPGVEGKEGAAGKAFREATKDSMSVSDIARKPGFKEAKSWDNPIEYIIANPGLENSVETRLTRLVNNRNNASIKAVATADYLKHARKFGVSDDMLSNANRYFEGRKKQLSRNLDIGDAVNRAKADVIDNYGFDPTLFTEKINVDNTDVMKLIGDYNFTPEVADYLTLTSQFFTDKNIGALLNLIKTFNKWWKSFATVVVPGFHMRNVQSNLYNMFLADGSSVFSPELHRHTIAAMSGADGDFWHPVLQRKVKYSELLDEAARRGTFDLGLVGEDISRLDKSQVFLSEKKFWQKAITDYNILSVEGPLVKKGTKLGQVIENEARLALFLDNWMKFGDPDHAARVVAEHLFNYRDITNFDNTIMKTFVPFWVWSKKNVPLQWKSILRQPRKFGLFVKFKDYMRNISEDPRTGEIPGYEWEPEYIKELFGVPTPFMTPSGTRMVYNPNFAFQDLGKLTSKDWLSGLGPPVKIPLELISGKEIFTGAPIRTKGSSGLREAPAYLDWLRKLKLPMPGVYDGVGYEGEPITMISPYLDYAIKQIPLAGNIGRAMPQSERLKEKTPLKLLSMLGGLKFFEHNPETAEYWHLKDRIEELERIKDYYRKTGLWQENP
jgi:hypothetical protein